MLNRSSRLVACFIFGIIILSAATVIAQVDAASDFTELIRQARIRRTDRDPRAAAGLWERALKLNPNDGRYWSEYGGSLIELKDYARARAAFEKALTLGAGYPWEQLYNIARCYVLAGDKAEALRWLERSVNEGHRNLNAIRANREFDSLRNDARFKNLLGIADFEKMTREEGWRFDLAFLAREIKRLHYDPYRRFSRENFDAYVKQFNNEIPRLTDSEIVVGLMKLAAMAGDGHTAVRHPAHTQEAGKVLPVQFYFFEDRLYITGATAQFGEILGAEVVAIGGHTIAELLQRVDPVISYDNRIWPRQVLPGLLRNPFVLNGLKLTPDPDRATLMVRTRDGKEQEVTFSAGAGAPDESWLLLKGDHGKPEPLYRRRRRTPYWFEYVSEQKTVWLQYNAIAHDPREPFPDFCQRVFKFVNEHDVDRLVVDLRWNGGGNTFLSQPLLRGLNANEKINLRGKLFVVIGRNTFSAAMNTATQIERYTNAIFVGEPTGSSPNFIGESIRIELPYSRMTGTVSDLYWQTSWPMDHRPWIPPLLFAPPTLASWLEGRDPAWEAILGYREP